ncbi:glycosyltransferase [Burkholderia orbicola]|uniref:Glycosyltransferase n=2 Tax=Burkholderia cepacia complex TaxID=87882 RepID=A0A3R9CPI2_9BURK|nr:MULTISPECIES: glycosyltransferase [Burkholderia]EKS9842780.1 glycosyltransferase [Burkholderia cepacia]BEV48127.1 glycosyltransferase [Burkholderia contaminans]ABK13177.1 glycosyl transferase, family 2 [Burkholderia cenocepacia HI2424]AQT54569.1 glycosyl transferase family 2 [Burkholderia cenocepacia]MBJ9666002.1 glycosyltransferase [Burkholderia cenocepacia]
MNMRDTHLPPVVSVVVPTYRRPDLLERCLDALCAQVFDPTTYEIVVVDDDPAGSARAVVDACRARVTDVPVIRYMTAPDTQGPAGARNVGWRSAGGALIAFTDDDTIPDPTWLRHGAAALLAEPSASAAAGRIDVPLRPRPTDYERDAAGLAQAEFATANCFVRRAALERIGGFDERFTRAWREDADLMFALHEHAGPIVEADAARIVHPVRPARWGSSIGAQSKVYFDALLYKKHRTTYRRHIRPTPPWHYYAAVLAALGAIGCFAAGWPAPAIVCAAVWAAITAGFCAKRLRGTQLTVSHVAEMIVTSIAIPPVSLYWRMRGALHFRVLFL